MIQRGHRLQLSEDELFERGGELEDVFAVPWGTLGEIPYAGRYRGWKVGRLDRLLIPLSRWALKPATRVFAEWFGTAIIGRVVSGVIVAWLTGGSE